MSTLTLKGPYWVTVRQYRRTLWLVAGAVLLSLASMVALMYVDTPTPGTDRNFDYTVLRVAMDWASSAMILLPLIVGAFVAGPMVARELESGTYKLALTQSVSPSRWLGSKLLTAGAVIVPATVALIGIYRLGWGNVAGTWSFQWYEAGTYEATGPVLVAQALLALGLGALIGQLIRRTVTAMALTGLVTGLVLLLVGQLRWSLMPVQTLTAPLTEGMEIPNVPASSWQDEYGLVTASGDRLPSDACWQRTEVWNVCPADMNVVAQYVDYHPSSHYWPIQLIETGIVLALAAVALYAAFRVLRARHP
ncbi:ABC transporter permease [Streptomyces narbonensis]|uniref:ABC transporter permease n=1 Tax=Streptomyces narbonensis TaxID=67333 RepID=UPI00167BCD1B|nr:ABC transporter permease [Streptomyces narbonensis]GGV98162.1 transporter [Streptomyces narbonensis]